MNEYIELKIEDWREWLPKYHGKEIEFCDHDLQWEKYTLTGFNTIGDYPFCSSEDQYRHARIKNPAYKKPKYTHSDIINGMEFSNMEYVRCTFCDTAITTDQIKMIELNKVEGIKHRYVFYVCPVCGLKVKSFVFKDDEMQEMNIQSEPPSNT